MKLKKYSKFIFKANIFVALLITFYQFYLKSQVSEFLKKSTTFTGRYEEVSKSQAPNLLLCFNPGFKVSAMKKVGYDQFDESFIFKDENERYHEKHNLTIWEAYQRLAYLYPNDFNLQTGVQGYEGSANILIKSVENVATYFKMGCAFYLRLKEKSKFLQYMDFTLLSMNLYHRRIFPEKSIFFL